MLLVLLFLNYVTSECDITCRKCSLTTDECIECIPTMFLNTETGKCSFCEAGMYYSNTREQCEDCQGTCAGNCRYQTHCFECPGNQKYSFKDNICVDECDEDEVFIASPYIHNLRICRLPIYHVNPASESDLELGTRTNPYKSINFPLLELYNLMSYQNVSATIKLAKSSTHFLQHHLVAVNNLKNLIIEPYDSSNTVESEQEYIAIDRAPVIIHDAETDLNWRNTQFNLLSEFQMDPEVILQEEESVQTLVNERPYVSLPIIKTNVAFKNLRIEDQISHLQISKIISFHAFKLEHNSIIFENVDFKMKGTILESFYPMNFHASEIMVIDYHNLDRGFSFQIRCNYEGATTTGQLLFEAINFKTEDVILPNKLRSGGILEISSPANVTIRDSVFSLHHRLLENQDVIEITDSGRCTPNDGLLQTVTFTNNSLTFDVNSSAIFNNFYLAFSGDNLRTKEVTITDNLFYNMHETTRTFLEVQAYSPGSVFLSGNTITNCSSLKDIFNLVAQETLLIQNNIFDTVSVFTQSVISTANAQNVVINNIEMLNFSNEVEEDSEPVILVATASRGNAVFENSTFHGNYAKSNFITFGESVGSLSFRHNVFYDETLETGWDYITISNLYQLVFKNCTFSNMDDNASSRMKTDILKFSNIDLSRPGNFEINSLSFQNVSMQFLTVSSVTGIPTERKLFDFSDIVFSDTVLIRSNTFMMFGPILTHQDIQFTISNFEVRNLIFLQGANIIDIRYQGPNPFKIVNATFENINGGYVRLAAKSTERSSQIASLEMSNITVTNCDFYYHTFLIVRQHSAVKVQDCDMRRNSGYFRGTVLSILDDDATTTFSNCIFSNNNGIEGGLFYVSKISTVNVVNSTLYDNFSVKASIAYVENQAKILMQNCTMNYNNVVSTGGVQIVDSSETSIFNNVTIRENFLISTSKILEELANPSICFNLCFASEGFLDYLYEKRAILDDLIFPTFLQVTGGNLEISEAKFEYMDKMSFATLFKSTVSVQNSTIEQLDLWGSAFTVLNSNLDIDSVVIKDVRRSEDTNARMFTVQSDSSVTLSNNKVSNVEISLSRITDAQLRIYNTTFENITTSLYMIECYSSYGIEFDNITISDSQTLDRDSMMYFRNCRFNSFSNSNLLRNQPVIATFRRSIVSRFDNNLLDAMYKGIQVIENSYLSMENTVIQNMQQTVKDGELFSTEIETPGSALEINDSHVTIQNCEFSNNSATSGGAIRISCHYLEECTNVISNSQFLNNTSLETGGAISYNSYAPIVTNNTFEGNSAPFDHDVASFPVKVMQLTSSGQLEELKELNNVPSGLTIDEEISFALVNVEGEVLTSDSESTIILQSITKNAKVSGQNVATLDKGVATFTDTVFNAEPGAQNVRFMLKSSAIKYAKVKYLDSELYKDQVFEVNFRWCKPGEIQDGNTCSACNTGTYSVTWNATKCNPCPNHASCEQESISLSRGYWRFDANSTEIVECPNEEACLGGFVPENKHPVKCAAGYKGLLCNECIVEGDTKYERISENQCSKCPDPAMNLLRIIGCAIAVLVFLAILISVNIQKREDSNVSVLMRIMTNYLQILAAALSYNLRFPTYLLDLLSSARRVGNSSGIFLSYDCLLMSSNVSSTFDNIAYLKVICLALLPLILISSSSTIYFFLFLHDKVKFKRYVCVTVITVLFLFHPTITAYALRIFKCVDIGGGISKVEMDITTDCYSGPHLKWVFSLAIPMTAFYILGCPLTAFVILYKNRKRLNHPDVLRYIILLYQGLRHEVYYWELINTLRKCVLLALHVFVPDTLKVMKALFGVILMYVVSLAQTRIKPFKIGVVSTLENREMIASLLTLYGGLIFVQKDNQLNTLSVVFFVLMFVANVRFIVLWVFCMTSVFKKRPCIAKLGRYIKRVFCLKVSIEDEDYLCYKSKLTTSLYSNTKNDTCTVRVPKSSTSYPKTSFLHFARQNMSSMEEYGTCRPILSKRSKFLDICEEESGTLRSPKKSILKPKSAKKKSVRLSKRVSRQNKVEKLAKKLVTKRSAKSSRNRKTRKRKRKAQKLVDEEEKVSEIGYIENMDSGVVMYSSTKQAQAHDGHFYTDFLKHKRGQEVPPQENQIDPILHYDQPSELPPIFEAKGEQSSRRGMISEAFNVENPDFALADYDSSIDKIYRRKNLH